MRLPHHDQPVIVDAGRMIGGGDDVPVDGAGLDELGLSGRLAFARRVAGGGEKQ